LVPSRGGTRLRRNLHKKQVTGPGQQLKTKTKTDWEGHHEENHQKHGVAGNEGRHQILLRRV